MNTVSIIMPVYNAEKFVSEAIQSVLNQTYENWELLIINDGSTDGSEAIIKSFKDSRLHYFVQENTGVGAARNVGLSKMKGAYFCFLDADDQFTPLSLEARILVFNKSDKIAFVDGNVKILDVNMTNVIRIRKALYEGKPFQELLNINPKVFFGPSWLVKRQPSCQYTFSEDMSHLEDLWFYMMISTQGLFSYTKEVILNYRQHEGSAMDNLNGIAKGYTMLTTKLMEHFRKDLTLFDKVVWRLRVRKIMGLSYFSGGNYIEGLKYIFIGR